MTAELSRLARAWIDAPHNPIALALRDARQQRLPFIDLATANPHEHGLTFPRQALDDAVRGVLDAPNVAAYHPDPRGLLPAREAIAAFYRRRRFDTHPDRILLTPGTSLAYFYALRILAEPGGEILVPKPGYPLFDDIAALCGLTLRYYHLTARSGAWRPDVEEIAFQCTPGVRAIMVVSPHNPAGTVFTAGELEALGRLCRERDLPVVFDEVFSEFLSPPALSLPRPQPGAFPLVVVLNGFSKMFSLPGWKVGWMCAGGDTAFVERFLQSLEYLSDTFLPVPEPIQALVSPILRYADDAISSSLAHEITRRRDLALRSLKLAVYPPDAGVYICCRLPEGVDEEEFCLRALRLHAVFVHPGYYYNLPPGHIVMTCVPRPEVLGEGIGRLHKAAGL